MLPLSFFASSIVGTSTRISFFQEFREFLTKSLHLRASCRFPLIDRLINGVGSRISLKPLIWQLFARSSGLLTLSPISRNLFFLCATRFPPTKNSSPFSSSISFSLSHPRCRVFSFPWFLSLALKIAVSQSTSSTILPLTIKTSPNYFFISRDTNKSYRGSICRFFS